MANIGVTHNLTSWVEMSSLHGLQNKRTTCLQVNTIIYCNSDDDRNWASASMENTKLVDRKELLSKGSKDRLGTWRGRYYCPDND